MHCYDYNRTFFHDIQSEHQAYWLGFLFADGYVNIDGVEITVAAQDKEHLGRLLTDINGQQDQIRYRARQNAYRLSLYSRQMSADLIQHGCVQAKSYVLTWPVNIAEDLINHFMRGYFDGDGTIWIDKKGNRHVEVTGTSCFLDEFERRLIDPPYTKRTRNKDWDHRIEKIRYGGNVRVSQIFSTLYRNATIYLPRKYVKFMPSINEVTEVNR